MKEKQLRELFESNTNEGEVDYSKVSESINTEFNSLLDKKMPDMDAEQTKWEDSYSQSFFNDLGLESINDKDTLASFITERKDLDINKITEQDKTIDKLTKQITVKDSGFKGDDFDFDTLMQRSTKLMATKEAKDFNDALAQIKEQKPGLFTTQETQEFKKSNLKNVKPGGVGSDSAYMEAYKKLKR